MENLRKKSASHKERISKIGGRAPRRQFHGAKRNVVFDGTENGRHEEWKEWKEVKKCGMRMQGYGGRGAMHGQGGIRFLVGSTK